MNLSESSFQHIPVMPEQVLENLALFPGAIAVDVTAGGGGHLAFIAEKVGKTGRVIGLDRDERAHASDAAGGVAKKHANISLFQAPFSALKQVLKEAGIEKVNALLCDLGVSSPQLDEPHRGFSFMRDGPLDMRMDNSSSPSALELIEQTKEQELANIIYEYGEERQSRRIARAIKKNWPLPDSTLAFAELIAKACGGKRGKIHPATRTFQALRIAVNHELDELTDLLKILPDILAPGGRAVFISFHSLEDRIIKHTFRKGAVAADGQIPLWRLLQKRPLIASEEEIALNPRSRSAKLRAVERYNPALEKTDAN